MSKLLERSGLVTTAGEVVGVEGPHPDAALLEMIERYTTLWQTSQQLFHRASQYKENGRVHKRLWREMMATQPQREALEQEIAATKAITPIGLIAKMGLWISLHGENTGTFMGHPLATMREAVTMLGETAYR